MNITNSNQWFWVLGWSTIPAGLHVISMIVFRFTVHPLAPEPLSPLGPLQATSPDHRPHALFRYHSDQMPTGGIAPISSFRTFLWNVEFAPCSERTLPRGYHVSQSTISQVARWITPFLSMIQYIIGTMVLSALLPVPFADAMPILVRYIASGVIARAIIGFELAGFKGDELDDDEDAGPSRGEVVLIDEVKKLKKRNTGTGLATRVGTDRSMEMRGMREQRDMHVRQGSGYFYQSMTEQAKK